MNSVENSVALLLLIAVAMGILLEFGQLYSPGRSFDTHDMLADVVGIITGAATGLLLRSLAFPHLDGPD
jgi:VanZ family protein